MNQDDIFDAFQAAQRRGILPTDLSSAELRDLAAGVRARSVFTARGTNAVFAGKLKSVIEELASGKIGEADARLALRETLKALNYTPEGGFPDAPGQVPSAVRGSLQDLTSFRRLNLIVRTQIDLMRGAGQQMRGTAPDRLAAFPCWELVRIMPVRVPRDWEKRWQEVGGSFVINGKFYAPFEETPWEMDDPRTRASLKIRMIAPKGDLIWGELGSAFDDSLDVDYPPFAFNSGMGWKEIAAAEARQLGITSMDGVPWEEFLQGVERPRVLQGELPLPTPRLSMQELPAELAKEFLDQTQAYDDGGEFSFDSILESELKKAEEAYKK